MPKLPVHTAQRGLSAQQTGQRIDSRLTGQSGRLMQQVGAGLVDFAGRLGQLEDKWQKAEVSNQYTTSGNERKGSINDILQRASEEPDHNKRDAYFSEIEDLRSQDVTINDEGVKEIYESETKLKLDMAGARLSGLFKSKLVNHQRGEIQKRDIDELNDYTEAGPKTRPLIMARHKNYLKSQEEAGFIKNEEYVDKLEDMKDWEYQRAMKAVGRDPEGTVEDLDSYGLDESQKTKVVETASRTISRNNKIRTIANLQVQSDNEEDLSFYIALDPSPLSEKIIRTDEMEALDEISKEFAASTRRSLKSKIAFNDIQKSPEIAQVVDTMYDANIYYDNTFDEEGYLRRLENIRLDIMNLKVSSKQKSTMFKELATITKKKKAEATQQLGASERKEGENKEIYIDSKKLFKETLPEHLTGVAQRDFFNATAGREVTKEQAEVIATQIGYKTMSVSRDARQDEKDAAIESDAMERAIEQEGSGADLRMQKNIDGNWYTVLYENGVLVKVVTRVSKAELAKQYKQGKRETHIEVGR